ncbi:ABC transporter ATP-binding protein [Marinicella sp. W31]|uniref:ABC transporter ATP-binding protein n=1 Tax=Marinicella sp. W31 TaxID=3023713 RepID=UPI0037579ABA
MSNYVIETQDLYKQFGQKMALSNLNLKVQSGGVHAIVGSNGAGKSTLFKLLLGVISPTQGSSKILGLDSQQLTPDIRGKVGFVNEEHTLPKWMRVSALLKMEQSFYPAWNQHIYQQVIGNFNVSPQQKINELSRGERAGLNLAMALAKRPKVLVLDEPTLGLDVVAKQAFLESVLFTEKADECTVIYCSHQMDEIERVADQLIVMEQGHLINVSTPEDFCKRIHYWVVNFPKQVPANDRIPGFLQVRCIEGEYHYMVIDQDATLKTCFEQLGASDAFQSSVSLNQAVNGFLSRNHHSPEQDTQHD